MNPYSHLAIAAQLEAEIQPVDVSDYYWGAVAPDVRYAAGTRRAQTHISPERVLSFFTKYPQLQSFTQGYLVHILTDLLKFRALLEQRILLWPLWLIFSGRVSTILLETYYVEKMPRRFDISGAPNPILRELGIPDEHAYAFAETLRPFVADPSPRTALTFLRVLRPSSRRVALYARLVNMAEQYPALKSFVFHLSQMDALNRQMLAALRNDTMLRQAILTHSG